MSLLLQSTRRGAEALEHQALSPAPWGPGAPRTLGAAVLRAAWILPRDPAEQGQYPTSLHLLQAAPQPCCGSVVEPSGRPRDPAAAVLRGGRPWLSLRSLRLHTGDAADDRVHSPDGWESTEAVMPLDCPTEGLCLNVLGSLRARGTAPSPSSFCERPPQGDGKVTSRVVLLVSGTAWTPATCISWTSPRLRLCIPHTYDKDRGESAKLSLLSLQSWSFGVLFQNLSHHIFSHKTTGRINDRCLIVSMIYLFGKHLMP